MRKTGKNLEFAELNLHLMSDLFLNYLKFIRYISENPEALANLYLMQMRLLTESLLTFNKMVMTFPNFSLNSSIQKPHNLTPNRVDKRFKSEVWNKYPFFLAIKEFYLRYSEIIIDTLQSLDLEESLKKKIIFYTKQWLDAIAPTNFILTNAEVYEKLLNEGYNFIFKGFENYLKDLQNGRISQTDFKAFEVGKNLATTEGSVIYQTPLYQLIQYKPKTKEIYEIPILYIPHWINKYYIIDLQPENSLIKYILENNLSFFLISWRNVNEELGKNITFDDYVKSVIEAMDIVSEVSKSKKVHFWSYCIGGTLAGIVLGYLAKKNLLKDKVESAIFMASMHDFCDKGPLENIIDNDLYKKMEKLFKNKGVFPGYIMHEAFNWIRSNDLVWTFFVNNYLKGENPSPFDLLYWTNDNTNFPAKAYLFYLKHIVIDNKLAKPNKLKILNTLIDLRKVDIPAFVIATEEDHISPARSVWATTELWGGEVEFLLGKSGHVMGIINPPSRNKYGYYYGGQLGEGFDYWKQTAKEATGSWWPYLMNWIKQRSGNLIPAPKQLGSDKYKEIEKAPGSYVLEKI